MRHEDTARFAEDELDGQPGRKRDPAFELDRFLSFHRDIAKRICCWLTEFFFIAVLSHV